ncbi:MULTISPECIES: hypothetical protein [Pseudomonas]|uniref:Membrane protein n=1 Tax=Pseudomonas cichorii TaxID=36746 RepID=A0A3M4VLW1_PSECI|nr:MULTISPECIES: hypothetical protein [Pseudomonas]QVE17059.1 hypothetical protein KGD89_25120 [Pseudomonas cichorii]RMR52846.1 Membrane protein [Pseudomonas cichorii]SDO81445.1 hypothetical protein SAMN05216599_113142 [Pseudomonas cichorii]GFM79155.1 hypothetical protein PSCICM_49740 [Pseudomonas cichorii]GFM93886.1 hypothetical protein PSCICP_38580 [Pseudomonas cichorii]
MDKRTANPLYLVIPLIAGAVALIASEPVLADPRELRIDLPDPLPHVRVLTVLVGLHLLGLCFGLGGATMLDYWILRWMRKGSLPVEIKSTFTFISTVVAIGLGLLWLSGLGFLALYGLESPEKLSNPKLWAKVCIVSALTLNGMLIHVFVLPVVLRDMSQPILDGVSRSRIAIFLASGALSAISWYTAFALGIFRELNNSVSFSLLIALWLTLTVAASLAASLLWMQLRDARKRRSPGTSAVAVDAIDEAKAERVVVS